MSKVSEAIKAKRQQHRKDHYTDADRALNGKGQKARRASRQEAFNAQGNKSAADFNFDQHGKGHIGGQEIRHLQNQGHSREDIMAAAKANGGEIGQRVQRRFDRWTSAKEKASAAKDNSPAPSPAPTTNVETGDNTNTQQVDNSTNTNVNQDNDIVNDISGNNNNVNNAQDNSVDTMGGSANTGNYQNSSTGSNTGSGNRMYSASVMPQGDKDTPMNSTAVMPHGYKDTNTPYYNSNSSTGSNKSAQQVDGSSTVNANQDNDITNDIEGDNNYVYNRQDNSIRNYGGDTRVFNYQGSGNAGADTPVSAAVMGGYYAVDDSHGANAARLDRRITMGNDYAKDNMDVDWITQGAMHRAGQNAYIDPAKLDSRVRAREQASFAQSKVNEANMWGDPDQYSWGGVGETPEPVEKPDFEAIGKVYTDY